MRVGSWQHSFCYQVKSNGSSRKNIGVESIRMFRLSVVTRAFRDSVKRRSQVVGISQGLVYESVGIQRRRSTPGLIEGSL